MVVDWYRAYSEGQDALMVAKRNIEVERLNAPARELMKAEGQLGAQEIEVGEARFAAGDQVITRVNDHASQIYNRERWQVAEVDPERGRIVLDGIDRAGTVEVGPDYLSRTTPHGEAPALQHAYAVTTYCAQGTTVDRAYVMTDPSMDKQELYVAISRSREETYLYATPEIRAERAEYAPMSPERDAIGHVAEAAERDRAQTAAHEEALRSELRGLPSKELVARREALREAASSEASADARRAEQRPAVELAQKRHENAVKQREAAEGLTLRDRRREREIARQVLIERAEPAILAARLAPPSYVVKELGERPVDSEKAKTWDRGVKGIETYRHEHGITDAGSALGRKPESGADRLSHYRARNAIREAQRRLGRQQQLDRSAQRSRDASRDTGMDIGL